MTLIKWKDNDSVFNILDNYNSIFNNYLNLNNCNEQYSWSPSFNINEYEKSYNIIADLPGLKKKEININIDDDVIIISGTRKIDNDSNNRLYCKEIQYGEFERRFYLPDNINKDNINASLKNGVLNIEIQKTKPIDNKLKQINIS